MGVGYGHDEPEQSSGGVCKCFLKESRHDGFVFDWDVETNSSHFVSDLFVSLTVQEQMLNSFILVP